MGESSCSSTPLQDRVAIVTGASRGIGRAIAHHLASLGAKVLINYSSSSAQADSAAAEINAAHPTPRAVTFKADISDEAQVKSLFDAAESAFGSPVDILVNNAAVVDPKYPTLAATSAADFDRTIAVNTRGAFLCCREAGNRLRRGGGGRIVCVTSSVVASLKPTMAAYAGSKAAVEAMVKVMAKELRGTGITANCVAPGPVATDMFYDRDGKEAAEERAVAECPLGRMGQVDDVAPVVGFLVGDAGEWVNGQIIRVNGGYV